MKLKLNETEFEALWQLARHVRLGQESVFSEAIYEVLLRMESIAGDMELTEDTLPEITASFNASEGIVLEFN